MRTNPVIEMRGQYRSMKAIICSENNDFPFFNKAWRTDRPTDGRTDPLIAIRGRIKWAQYASYNIYMDDFCCRLHLDRGYPSRAIYFVEAEQSRSRAGGEPESQVLFLSLSLQLHLVRRAPSLAIDFFLFSDRPGQGSGRGWEEFPARMKPG